MSIGDNDLIMLDTNTLVHWVRQDSTGKYLLAQYGLDQRPERPAFPSVVEGEIRGLARCWNWGVAKFNRLDDILAELVRIDAGHPAIVQAYAELYYEDQRGGRNTGENDLWIAATARATNAVLLTLDNDFRWMTPNLARIEISELSP